MGVGALSSDAQERNVPLKAPTKWWGKRPPCFTPVPFVLAKRVFACKFQNFYNKRKVGVGALGFGAWGRNAPLAAPAK